MKFLFAVLLSMVSFVALGQDAPVAEPDKFSKIMSEASIWVALVVMVVEYLIGVSKLKSNSMIESVMAMLKMIFGAKK